jgi:hypothetical protein
VFPPGREVSRGRRDHVVGKYFRLTFVFNGLKTSLNLYLSSFIALKIFLIFEIRGVLSLNILRGRQSS